MTKLTIRNLMNSPFDLEGGIHLPAMGSVTEEFTDDYAVVLRGSPGIEVSDAIEEPSRVEPAKSGKKRRG